MTGGAASVLCGSRTARVSVSGMPRRQAVAEEHPPSEGEGEGTALVVVDMFNDYRHPDGDALRASAEGVVPVIADLLGRWRDGGGRVIFVNDHQGRWDASGAELVELARRGGDAALIDPIDPRPGEAFLMKARHSIFYASSVGYLLESERIDRLVLCGQVTEQCILYSALDAYLRHFAVTVPCDAVACIDERLADAALEMMARNMHVDVADAADIAP